MKRIKEIKKITLLDLVKVNKLFWLLSVILIIITYLTRIGLLAASGWFISATAIAGINLALAYQFNYYTPGAIIRMLAIMRTFSSYATNIISHNAVLSLLKELRCYIFYTLTIQKNKFYNFKYDSSVLMHRLVLDIDRLNLFPLQVLLPWIGVSVCSILTFLFFYLVHPILFYSSFLFIILSWIVIPIIGYSRSIYLSSINVENQEEYRNILINSLSLMTSLLLWKTWDRQYEYTTNINFQRINHENIQQNLVNAISLIQKICLIIGLGIIIIQGSYLIKEYLISLPWFLAVILTYFGLYEIIIMLSSSFISFGISIFSKNRINEIIDDTILEEKRTKIDINSPYELVLKNISAKFTDSLNGPNNINFTLKNGEILLLSGPSGVGKSTLLELIAGNYLLKTSGDILLNNIPINKINLDNIIGYLTQQLDIFNMSLKDNLKIANIDADDKTIWAVLADVELDSWARENNGLDTILGEGGSQISGGQARRIALARLLLTNRPILLLDEPFAGLDKDTIEKVFFAIKNRLKNGILIIVSHQDIQDGFIKRIKIV